MLYPRTSPCCSIKHPDVININLLRRIFNLLKYNALDIRKTIIQKARFLQPGCKGYLITLHHKMSKHL